MKRTSIQFLLSMLTIWLTVPAFAEIASFNDNEDQSIIDIGGYDVPVKKGGLYDRYRSNPPLSVIQQESPKTDLSWFKTLEKTKVDIGFESYSPNFYYENSKVTVIYTADLERLKSLMPQSVLNEVQPLQVWPGRGLVALTAYAYHYCDNDSYNEISLAVVTGEPGSVNLGPLSLVGQAIAKDFWGYVLKLPVDTELARVRGIVGYNLPKWLTPINYFDGKEFLKFEVKDQATGKVDFVLQANRLEDISEEPVLVNNSFTNVDANGKVTVGNAVTRMMKHGVSMDDEDIYLSLTNGSFSSFIKSLDLGAMVRYEYVPSFQSALYAPTELAITKR